MRIDEDEFIKSLLPTLTADDTVAISPGDDCAALYLGGGELLLLAVDQVAADSHYFGPDSAEPTPPELAGRKLLARNLSDIAAMGGRPRYALLAVSLPEAASPERLAAFIRGVRELAAEYNVHIIGGDLAGAPAEVGSLTILGTVAEGRVCRRNAARAGEGVFVTGEFGNSLASEKHLRFRPRLEEGQWLAQGAWTQCMIDASDGLLKDLGRLCRASELRARLEESAIPRTTGADLEQALLEGEDYELIFSVPPDKAADLREEWPFETRLTEIGQFEAGDPVVINSAGEDLTSKYGPTFDHFST